MLSSAHNCHAQTVPELPGSVDPGRIFDNQQITPDQPRETPSLNVPDQRKIEAPDGAENLLFTLSSVNIEGMSVYDQARFKPLFEDKIGTDVPATLIWEIAAEISEAYKRDGYFLSRAFVPAQKIDTGDIRIAVIEGYIQTVEIEGKNKDDRLVRSIANKIIEQSPTKIKELESSLLRLGDLHGVGFDAVLDRKQDAPDGAITLALKPQGDENPRITVSSNNYGSRFLGPHRGSVTFEHSLIDYQKTTISALADLPRADELALGSINHRVQITPSVELDFMLSKSISRPGFTLRQSDIESDSFSWGFGAQWIPIRQRDQNFRLFARLEALNSNTNTFSIALTRDKVRAFRLGARYDFKDRFLGLNTVSLTLSQGISAFGASDANNPNASRGDAAPDFNKLELAYNRQDFISNNLLLNLNLRGQLASRGLYSSEEFGFGGINAGRAYDFSEITGDHGLSALAELQYAGFTPINGYQISPFVFYDIGKTWNEGDASVKSISASSAGIGTRIYGDNSLNFDAMLAFPLTKSIDNPLYGNGKNPVLRFGLIYQF